MQVTGTTGGGGVTGGGSTGFYLSGAGFGVSGGMTLKLKDSDKTTLPVPSGQVKSIPVKPGVPVVKPGIPPPNRPKVR